MEAVGEFAVTDRLGEQDRRAGGRARRRRRCRRRHRPARPRRWRRARHHLARGKWGLTNDDDAAGSPRSSGRRSDLAGRCAMPPAKALASRLSSAARPTGTHGPTCSTSFADAKFLSPASQPSRWHRFRCVDVRPGRGRATSSSAAPIGGAGRGAPCPWSAWSVEPGVVVADWRDRGWARRATAARRRSSTTAARGGGGHGRRPRPPDGPLTAVLASPTLAGVWSGTTAYGTGPSSSAGVVALVTEPVPRRAGRRPAPTAAAAGMRAATAGVRRGSSASCGCSWSPRCSAPRTSGTRTSRATRSRTCCSSCRRGALSAVLVPTFVELLDRGDVARMERLAGRSARDRAAAARRDLGRRDRRRALDRRRAHAGVDEPMKASSNRTSRRSCCASSSRRCCSTRIGAVAVAVLYAKRHLTVTAIAPIGYTVVVVDDGSVPHRHRTRPSVDLSTGEALILALGATLGVAAFVGIPFVADVAQRSPSRALAWAPRRRRARGRSASRDGPSSSTR